MDGAEELMLPAREVVETEAAFETGRAEGDRAVISVYEAGTRPAVGELVGLILTQPEPSAEGFVSLYQSWEVRRGEVYHLDQRR